MAQILVSIWGSETISPREIPTINDETLFQSFWVVIFKHANHFDKYINPYKRERESRDKRMFKRSLRLVKMREKTDKIKICEKSKHIDLVENKYILNFILSFFNNN